MTAPEPVSCACVHRVDVIFTLLSIRRLRTAGVEVSDEDEDAVRGILRRAADAGIRVRLQLVDRLVERPR